MRVPRLLIGCLVAGLSFCCPAANAPLVSHLECEFTANPMGVDVAAPRLSWQMESTERGQRQTAFQVLVATSLELLDKNRGDLWDSGKVASDVSQLVPYAGKRLSSLEQVFWRVRVWDARGQASGWSEPQSWTMGLLSPEDWQAAWIGLNTNAAGPAKIGYHSATTPRQDDTKWVQVDLGKVCELSKVVLRPMVHAKVKGFGFPRRFKVELSVSPDFSTSEIIADRTAADYPSPHAAAVSLQFAPQKARFVRVTATKLFKRDASNYVFALCELEAFQGNENVALGGVVTAKDTIEEFGWGLAGLTDGACGGSATGDPQTLVLRKEFQVRPGLRRAVLSLCGLGCYEATLNGRKVGDALFPGGWTMYNKTCLYDSYDVTGLLTAGPNAAGILLGNGMYNVRGGRYFKFLGSFGPLKAVAQLRLEYADGSIQTMATGPDWQIHEGPITFSCVYGGEDYDARREMPGWDKAGFAADGWKQAIVVPGPGGALKGLSCSSPPIRAFETFKPVKVTDLGQGVRVFDFGQNASMMPRLKVRGPAGATVRMIPAELVHEDGTANRQSCGGGEAWWHYTLKGTGQVEEYFPKFYYHGCRYFQVECAGPVKETDSGEQLVQGSWLPGLEIEGVVVHADCQAAGEFECSNELCNRIRKLVRWAQRSNMMSVMTDCPHRERLGWLEEDHLNGPALRYEFDMARLFSKELNDMADSQRPDGLVPDIAPEYVRFGGGFADSPEWGSACVIVPWQQYLFNGDIDLLRRYYPVMEAYVAYLGTRSTNHIVSHGLGDWYDIGPKSPGVAQLTPVPLTATAFYYYDAYVLSKAAALLGDSTRASKYAALSAEIKEAFNKTFYKPQEGFYAKNSQAGNAIPLAMDLAPDAIRQTVINAIVADIEGRGNALTAGDVGYRYLLRALADGNRSDVIYRMNNQSAKPGYGYQLARGATSLTEAWDARPQSSNNHFMLGQITEWFYHDLAGIQPCVEAPGFKKIRIKPAVLNDLDWARASYRSGLGLISSRWEKKAGRLTLSVTIPPNATGEIWVPAKSADQVSEGKVKAAKARGVKLLRREGDCAVFAVESGSFQFEAPQP